jgi:hypothetical protein
MEKLDEWTVRKNGASRDEEVVGGTTKAAAPNRDRLPP